MASLRGYKAFFDRALQAHLAYGSSLLMALVAGATAFAVTVMIWHYALRGNQLPGLFAYLTMAFILNYTYNLFLERSVGERIREGLIATDLLKPVDFQFFYMVQSFSDVIFQFLVAMAAFLIGLAFLGRELLPASGTAFAFFLISFVLAYMVNYGICFIFVQGVFVTNSNYGIFASRVALHQTFSGVFAPLTLFPPAFRAVADALPFQHVVYTPSAIYMGWIQGAELRQALLMQALWACGLILMGRLIFKSILSRLAIQGG